MTDEEFDQHMARHIARQKRSLLERYGWGGAPAIPAPPGGALSVVYAHTPYGGWARYDERHGWRSLTPGDAPPVDEQMRPFTRADANHPPAPSQAEYERRVCGDAAYYA